MHMANPRFNPRAITKTRVILRFPVQNKHGISDVSAHVVYEKVGFRVRVTPHRVMIHADAFTTIDRTPELIVRRLIHTINQASIIKTARAPSGTRHNEISVKRVRINITLPIAHVNTTHIRISRWHHSQ